MDDGVCDMSADRRGAGLNRLTAMFVRQTKQPGVYVDGGGLRFQVTASGGRRWFMRVTFDGKSQDIALGAADVRSLQEVRDLAVAIRREVADGRNPATLLRPKPPVVVSEAVEHRPTFTEAWEAYWGNKSPQLSGPSAEKNRALRQRQMEVYVLPIIGHRPIADIKPTEILEMFSPIWNVKEETARRLLQRVDSVFVSAIMRQWRDRVSPCLGVGRELGSSRQNRKHQPALPWSEVPGFIRDLRNRGGMTASRLALEFLVINANRSGEVRGAVWSEFDLGAKLWTIPAERMKMKRGHVIPLSCRAIEILDLARAANPIGDLVFPSTKGQPFSDMTLTKRLRDMGLYTRATAHGFRSSFKDWCAENGVRDEVSEAALAHSDKNQVRAAYLRTNFLEDRIGLMENWSKYCCKA